jgi:ABC-2 type transport system permease protein
LQEVQLTTEPVIEKAPRSGEQPAASGKTIGIGDFVRDTLALADVELRKLKRDPAELFTRAIQPALWILIFGQVFGRIRAMPTGPLDYLTFMVPGILAQSVLFIAIFYGISVIWERDLGILQKLLVSPAPRTALVLGKALSAGIRGLSQGIIIYILALLLRIHLDFSPWHVAGVIGFIVLGSALFSTFSLAIACVVKTRERFMGIGQVLTMPLFFASNAIYPIGVMPGWVRAIAKANPLSYQVDALRSLMVHGGQSVFGIGMDAGALLIIFFVLVLMTGWLYPNVIQ